MKAHSCLLNLVVNEIELERSKKKLTPYIKNSTFDKGSSDAVNLF